MPEEPASDLKFEIGHVLFIDIVGYSKLLITEQPERLQVLNEIVRSSTQFRRFADAIAMVKDAIATRDLPFLTKVDYGCTLADLKRFSGDSIGAQIAWQQLRDEGESLRRQTQGTQFTVPAGLAAAYAALGDERKALAIVDQVPVDALNVGGLAYVRARIAVYAGNKDSAVEQLTTSAHNPVPGGPGFSATYGDLKLNPVWDPLRGDSRFEKIVASLAPKKDSS